MGDARDPVTTQVGLWLLEAIEHAGTEEGQEALANALSAGNHASTVEYACQLAHALMAGMQMRVMEPGDDPEDASARELANVRAALIGTDPPNYFDGMPS